MQKGDLWTWDDPASTTIARLAQWEGSDAQHARATLVT
jgi:hypothetical protein